MSGALFILTATAWFAAELVAAAEEPPLVVAHRGASYDAPENTLAAFRLAWEKGAPAIEGDFYLSSDGHVVCVHDDETERTSGVAMKVSESTLEELRALDVGSWKHTRFAGERIPTLDEVLATAPEGGIVLVEVKCGPEVVPALLEAFDRSGLPGDQLRVIAFDAEVVAAMEQARPATKTYWLTSLKPDTDTARKPTLGSILRTLERIGADGLDVQASHTLDADFVAALRARELEFHVWTVNDRRDARWLAALGADSITTDRPQWLAEGLKLRPVPEPDRRFSLDGSMEGSGPGSGTLGVVEGESSSGPQSVFGVRGRAVDLRGTGARLRLETTFESRGTLSAWFQVTERGPRRLVESPKWRVDMDENGGVVLSKDGAVWLSADPLEAGWHHLAVVWDFSRGVIRLALDGTPTRGFTEFEVGAHLKQSIEFGDGGPRDGAWDEITWHHRSLDVAELRALHAQRAPR